MHLLSCTAHTHSQYQSMTPSVSQPDSISPHNMFHFMSHQPTQTLFLSLPPAPLAVISISTQGPSAGPSRPVSHHKNKHFERGEVSASACAKGGGVNCVQECLFLGTGALLIRAAQGRELHGGVLQHHREALSVPSQLHIQ